MRIFLTGGHGMVGRNLRAHPLMAAYEIHAPSRMELDLLDAPKLESLLREIKPDVLIHCAGKVGGVEANRRANSLFLAENARLALDVILAAKSAGVPRLLNLASSCMYPKDRESPLKEEELLTGPLEPTNEGYALAKLLGTRLTQFISSECPAFHYKTMIPCNLYGPWDKFDPLNAHLIPAILRKIREAGSRGEESLEIWGDGSARREFMYVEDLVAFIALCMDRFDDVPPIVNVGAGEDHSVLDYYRTACRVTGFEARFRFDPSKPAGMRRKLMDSSAARALGWRPRISLEDGITRTYAHFLEQCP